MPLESPVRVVRELTSRGYNADREAVTLLASADDPSSAIEHAVDAAPGDAITLTVDHVRDAVGETDSSDSSTAGRPAEDAADRGQTSDPQQTAEPPQSAEPPQTTGSRGTSSHTDPAAVSGSPAETMGVSGSGSAATNAASSDTVSSDASTANTAGGASSSGAPRDASGERTAQRADRDQTETDIDIAGDITGESTGTGEYKDFVGIFRDRYERLSKKLRGRVNHRPTDALDSMPGGSEAATIGMVNDVRSTASGHWLVELEDTNGVFPALVMKDRDIAAHVDELLMDEVIAVEGSLSSDGGILFVDDLYFPDIPRTHDPNTADRHVQAALVSDVHVGSQEFADREWSAFADWLHTEEADPVEYLLIAGDMVEGVGVYPNQDDELDIVDIYDQYETFAEHLKDVPGDMEIVMIPGNHDAVRLAEPQPAFDEELRDIMSAHDATITGNPSTVTVEGVDVLMYHGVSIDEVIAENPDEDVSYDNPHRAMAQLLKKRHVAPQFGGRTRLAPEEEDYLVVDDAPDVFHTGHVHKLGVGGYHNVRLVNSGCWQHQTAFQESVNIQPDVATAPILDLDTLDVTVRKF